jgi:mono/diheme cytochrome c family protein
LKDVTVKTAAVIAAVAVDAVASLATVAIAQDQKQEPKDDGAQAQVDQARIDQVQVDHGKMTYAQKCSHCHGPNMVNSGTITPDLRAFPDDKTRFVTTVKQGKNNKMPPWGDILTDDEIMNLWAFISSRRKP